MSRLCVSFRSHHHDHLLDMTFDVGEAVSNDTNKKSKVHNILTERSQVCILTDL